MNDLINPNWSTFQSSDTSYRTFSDVIKYVEELNISNSLTEYNPHENLPSKWIKWKDYSNQVVLRSDKYVFKIYAEDYEKGYFTNRIRTELAKIYNSYGIQWDIYTIDNGKLLFQIERRQILDVIPDDSNMSFKSILLGWKETLDKLESALKLQYVTYQLQDQIQGLRNIKLVRDCINKYADYAVFDGKIILLDDSDWFLALLDKEGNWLDIPNENYSIDYDGCPSRLSPSGFYNSVSTIETLGCHDNRWSIYKIYEGVNTPDSIEEFKSKREKILENNIKFLFDPEANADSVIYYDKIKTIGRELLEDNSEIKIEDNP